MGLLDENNSLIFGMDMGHDHSKCKPKLWENPNSGEIAIFPECYTPDFGESKLIDRTSSLASWIKYHAQKREGIT